MRYGVRSNGPAIQDMMLHRTNTPTPRMMSICLAMLLCVSALMGACPILIFQLGRLLTSWVLVYKLYKYFKPYGDANNPFLTGRDTLTVFSAYNWLDDYFPW